MSEYTCALSPAAMGAGPPVPRGQLSTAHSSAQAHGATRSLTLGILQIPALSSSQPALSRIEVSTDFVSSESPPPGWQVATSSRCPHVALPPSADGKRELERPGISSYGNVDPTRSGPLLRTHLTLTSSSEASAPNAAIRRGRASTSGVEKQTFSPHHCTATLPGVHRIYR